ncbi:hypothetical protein FRB90_012254 [Tulasnella sp. 427]|nr:hypothetical protein FRB90_012254 [Tulasnella sp. 427]
MTTPSTSSAKTSLPLEMDMEDEDPISISVPPPLPQLDARMLVTFQISTTALQREWQDWPDFVEQVKRMKFKRYHAYVYLSEVYDPLGLWNSESNRPLNPPLEKVRLALIGTTPPPEEFFNANTISMDPSAAAEMCHPIGLRCTGSARREESALDEQPRTPLRVNGPELTRCKFDSAYVYTGTRFEVIGTSLSSKPSPDGLTKRWMIANFKEDDRLGKSFLEDDIRLRKLAKDYYEEELLPPTFTVEHDIEMIDGIDVKLDFADYYAVPAEISLDLDVEEGIQDPCDFWEEVVSIRR